jgi:hypothetical protein
MRFAEGFAIRRIYAKSAHSWAFDDRIRRGAAPRMVIAMSRPSATAAISICSAERFARPAAASITHRNETIVKALVVPRHDQVCFGQQRTCRELMNAITAIPEVDRGAP